SFKRNKQKKQKRVPPARLIWHSRCGTRCSKLGLARQGTNVQMRGLYRLLASALVLEALTLGGCSETKTPLAPPPGNPQSPSQPTPAPEPVRIAGRLAFGRFSEDRWTP